MLQVKTSLFLVAVITVLLSVCAQAWGGVWLAAENLSDSDPATARDADSPQVAFDGVGNAIAIWSRDDGSSYQIQARHFSASSAQWGRVTDFPTGLPARDNYSPQIAVNRNGNAMAVWRSARDGSSRIMARHFNASTGRWGSIDTLSDTGVDSSNPQVAMDPQGNAMAVWQSQGIISTVEARSFSAATGGWEDPTVLSSIGANRDIAPQVAVDQEGNAIAVWQETNGSDYSVINTKMFQASSGNWDRDATRLSSPAALSDQADVALDRDGNAVSVWRSIMHGIPYIYARYFDRSGGDWDTLNSILSESGQAEKPNVAFDQAGNVIAVWEASDAESRVAQSKIRNRSGAGRWSGLSYLSNLSFNTELNAGDPSVAVAPNGDAIAIWKRHYGGNYRVHTRSYSVSRGSWANEIFVLSARGHDTDSTQIALDANGNAIAIWKLNDGARSIIQASYFDVDRTVEPPSRSPQTENSDSLAGFIARQPLSALRSACRLRINRPKTRDLNFPRKLFSKGFKGRIEWGTVAGRRVSCKKIKVAIYEKRGKRLYLPGMKVRMPSSARFNVTINRHNKRFGAHKQRLKEVPGSYKTNISYKLFDRAKPGRAALKRLAKRHYKGVFYIYMLVDIEGRRILKRPLELRVRYRRIVKRR